MDKEILPFLRKNYWVFALIAILFVAFYLRGAPGWKYMEDPMKRLPDIDTYFLYRMGEYIIDHGDLPSHDYLAQWGTTPGGPDRHQDYVIVLWAYPLTYFLLHPLLGVDWFWIAVWVPAIFSSLTVVVFFFLTKELFGSTKAGLLAAAFLAIVPGVLFRSAAGEIEKEALGGLLMVLSMWFFVKSYNVKSIIRPVSWIYVLKHPLSLFHKTPWKEERILLIKNLLYGVISGFFLFLMVDTWGGTRFVLIILAVFIVAAVILNRYAKRLLTGYLSFFVTFFVLAQTLSSYTSSWNAPEMFMNYFAIFFILLRFALERFKVVEKKYLPYVPAVIVVVSTLAVFGAGYILPDFGQWINSNVLERVGNPIAVGVIGSTVAEAQQGGEFFSNAVNNFGTNTAIGAFGLPQPFIYLSIIWFAFIGLVVMAYEFIFRKRNEGFIFAYVFFLIAMILSIGTVRLVYAFAFPVSLAAGYCLARGYDFTRNRTKDWKGVL